MLSQLALKTLLKISQKPFTKRLQTLRFRIKRLKQDQDLQVWPLNKELYNNPPITQNQRQFTILYNDQEYTKRLGFRSAILLIILRNLLNLHRVEICRPKSLDRTPSQGITTIYQQTTAKQDVDIIETFKTILTALTTYPIPILEFKLDLFKFNVNTLNNRVNLAALYTILGQ